MGIVPTDYAMRRGGGLKRRSLSMFVVHMIIERTRVRHLMFLCVCVC